MFDSAPSSAGSNPGVTQNQDWSQNPEISEDGNWKHTHKVQFDDRAAASHLSPFIVGVS